MIDIYNNFTAVSFLAMKLWRATYKKSTVIALALLLTGAADGDKARKSISASDVYTHTRAAHFHAHCHGNGLNVNKA